MDNLIYRSVEHDGKIEKVARAKHALIYRGFGHDGFSAPIAMSARKVTLCYRGILHSAAAAGSIGLTERPRTTVSRNCPGIAAKERVSATA
mgnify:CR=1 FL=1